MTTLVVGNIPPPVDGAGMVTKQAINFMEEELRLRVEVFDPFDERRSLRSILVYLKAALRIAKPDVDNLYIQGVQGERMFFVLFLLVVAKIFRTPAVHHHHAFKFIDSPSLLWRAICSRRFDVSHIVLSPSMGQRMESEYGNPNWNFVSNAAFVCDEFIESRGSSADQELDDLVVLFAGVAGIGKGEDIVIEAVRRVRSETGQPIKVVLAGRDHTTSEDFVEVTGVLNSTQLAERMSRASVFALPSNYAPEAAPMVIYEAAARGLVSITTARGCLPEMSQELRGAVRLAEPDVTVLAEVLLTELAGARRPSIAIDFDKARSQAINRFAKLFTPDSEATELSHVLLAQLVGAQYRSEVFSLAANLGCDFVWGDQHFQEHILSTPSMPGVSPRVGKNKFFFGRRLVWQTRSFRKMLTVTTLVIEANPRWLNSVLVTLARKSLGRHTVFWGHFDHHGDAGNFRRFVRKAYQRLPDCWMAYTESEAIRFRKSGLESVAAPNPLPPCSDPGFVVSGDGEDLLFLGRIDENKGLDVVLKAIASGSEETQLHVVGDGPSRLDAIELAAELGIADRVNFHGFLPCSEELHSIMKLCRAIVIPTYVGLNLTQAMAHGLGALVNSECSHSPEIEVARRFPEAVIEHDGTVVDMCEAIAELPSVDGTPKSAALIRAAYGSNQWLNGLTKACSKRASGGSTNCTHSRSTSLQTRKSESVNGTTNAEAL